MLPPILDSAKCESRIRPKIGFFPQPAKAAEGAADLVAADGSAHVVDHDQRGSEMATEVWDRFTVHHTPTHGSWLNQAEIEIGIFARQCLGKRRIPDLKTLRREVQAWNPRINRARTKINWKFGRKEARRKFGYRKNSFKRSET